MGRGSSAAGFDDAEIVNLGRLETAPRALWAGLRGTGGLTSSTEWTGGACTRRDPARSSARAGAPRGWTSSAAASGSGPRRLGTSDLRHRRLGRVAKPDCQFFDAGRRGRWGTRGGGVQHLLCDSYALVILGILPDRKLARGTRSGRVRGPPGGFQLAKCSGPGGTNEVMLPCPVQRLR